MESESIKEESIQLLKEQATRLKMQNKEIELRDEQVRFLKETMLALEQEKDALQLQNNQWKSKLKLITSEISQYNANVVQKIYEENQELLNNVRELEDELESALREKEEVHKLLKQTEGRLLSHTSEKQELSTANENLKEVGGKQERRVTLLEKQNKELQLKNISLQRQLDESSSQITYCSQQIDVLTQKHHEAIKISEKKLRQVVEKMVMKEQFERVDKEAKDAVSRNKQLRSELDKTIKEGQKLKFQLSGCRDTILTMKIKEETKSQQLKIDFINLHQSLKIGKRIAEFQSEEHQVATSIYELAKSFAQRVEQAELHINEYAEQSKEAEIERRAVLEHCKLLEVELERVRQSKIEEEECMEAEYEHKIMQISLRLKKEEIALATLKYKQNELESLKEQREQEIQENRQKFEAMNRTIEELRRENTSLGVEMGSTLKLCEGSLLNRECITHYKYVVQDLVGVIYFLHLHLMRHRERSMKLFKPFVNYYLSIHPLLQSAEPKSKRRRPRKLRSVVYVLVALFRMRKERGRGKGLEWYAFCATERRLKLENLNQHIEMLSNSILDGGKAVDLLRSSENIYRWRVNNYLRVKLPTSDDHKRISQCELSLDSLD